MFSILSPVNVHLSPFCVWVFKKCGKSGFVEEMSTGKLI